MATVDRIQKNYYGLTLYVSTKGRAGQEGHNYACQAVTWEEAPHKTLRVYVQALPGLAHYSGWVHLGTKEREVFFNILEKEREAFFKIFEGDLDRFTKMEDTP